MTPVEQTRYGKGEGNCLTACVASMLDLPISALPEFCVDGEWFDRLHKFCVENGFSLTYWTFEHPPALLCLNSYLILLMDLEGISDRHAVVARSVVDEKIIHDNGDFEWTWKAEIVHDPNFRCATNFLRVNAYILIGRQ